MIKQLKSRIRKYFGFSGTETKGFMVLVILFPIVLILPAFLKIFINQNTTDITVKTKQLDSLVALMEEKIVSWEQAKYNKKATGSVELIRFNPNLVSYEEMLALGLTPKVAGRIMNYRKKGGHFKVKKDFKKIYGLTEAQFNRLKGYIDLPNDYQYKEERPEIIEKEHEFSDKVLNYHFDINQVDEEQLRSIRGIGPTLSVRIVKFRNRLGGFVAIEQVEEVYGLSAEIKEVLQERGYVENDFRPELININHANADELSVHPYITGKLASQMIKYRSQHGAFKNLEQLMNIHIIGKHDYDKLKPYLTL